MTNLILIIGEEESLHQEGSYHVSANQASLFVQICKPKTFKVCSVR
jgi:hypothetical protein